MPRFRKGTMDHDNDGRMGGSMKETDMVKVKGTTPDEKKVVAAAKKAAKAPRKAARTPTRREDTPEAQKTPEAQQEAAEDQFAKADAAVVGNPDDPGEFRLRMAALGGL